MEVFCWYLAPPGSLLEVKESVYAYYTHCIDTHLCVESWRRVKPASFAFMKMNRVVGVEAVGSGMPEA